MSSTGNHYLKSLKVALIDDLQNILHFDDGADLTGHLQVYSLGNLQA